MKLIKFILPVLFILFMLPNAVGQNLAKDAVVAYWNFYLNEEDNAEKIEAFLLADYIPALKKAFEGANFFLLKNDRGNNVDGYSILVIFKSVEARNEWWPEQGKSTDKAKKAAEGMKEIAEEFNSMMTMESWNDWLVL